MGLDARISLATRHPVPATIAHLPGRHHQVVEPGSPRVAIPNAKAQLPGEPSALALSLMVTRVIGTRCLVRVSGLGQNPPRRRRQPMEALQQPSSPMSVPEQPEVLPNITMVSKEPSRALTPVTEQTRASRTPRSVHVLIARREMSIATTS